MATVIQVWTAPRCQSGAVCLGSLSPWQAASGSDAYGTAASLRILVPRDVAEAASVGEGRALRVVSGGRGEEWWFVTQVADAEGDSSNVSIAAGSIRQLLAVRGLIRSTGAGEPVYRFTTGSSTPADLLTNYVLSNLAADGLSWLSLGTVDYTAPIEVGTLDRVNRATLLDRIEQATGFRVVLRPQYTAGVLTGFALDVSSDPAAGLPVIPLSGASCRTLSRTRDALTGATVAVPFTADGTPMRECVWEIAAVTGSGPYWVSLQDLSAGLPAPIREDGQLDGYRLVQRDGTATTIDATRSSDSAVRVASIGTLAVGQHVTVLTSGNLAVQEVSSPSGIAGSRGRLVATVGTGVSNLFRRELTEDGGITQWTSPSAATKWSNEQAGAAFTPQHARYARSTSTSWTATVSQAVDYDAAVPVIYKTLTFSGAPANSWLFDGEILALTYTDDATVILNGRVETVQADSSGNGTITFYETYSAINGIDTTNLRFASAPPLASGTIAAGSISLVLVTPRPTFPAAGTDVLRTGFRFPGGAATANARVQNTKVKVLYNAATPYLHYRVSVTLSALETFYNLYSDTALVACGVGLVEDTGGYGTLLASTTSSPTGSPQGAPTSSLTSLAARPNTQATGTQVDMVVGSYYTMSADKTVRLALYPARCRLPLNSILEPFAAEASAITYWHTASLSLSESATPPDDTPSDAGANQLWHRAQDVLQGAGQSTRYTLRGVDLEYLERAGGTLALGQRVYLRSDELGINATVRILRLDFSLGAPETLDLELGAITPRLTGVTVSL